MIVISRNAALRAGISKFYTGKACKHGHLTERYTVSGSCIDCTNPKLTDYKSPEVIAAKLLADGLRHQANELRRQADVIDQDAAKLIQDARNAAATSHKLTTLQRLQEVAITRQSREQMTLRGFRLLERDLQQFTSQVVGLGQLVNAGLTERDLFPSTKGTKKDGLSSWYKFYCTDEHYDILLQISNALLTSPSL